MKKNRSISWFLTRLNNKSTLKNERDSFLDTMDLVKASKISRRKTVYIKGANYVNLSTNINLNFIYQIQNHNIGTFYYHDSNVMDSKIHYLSRNNNDIKYICNHCGGDEYGTIFN